MRTELAAELSRKLGDQPGIRAVYLFGSALTSASPEDVDLVVVYGAPLKPGQARSALAALIEEAVDATWGLPAHLMFFSESEASEPGLLRNLEAEAIYVSN